MNRERYSSAGVTLIEMLIVVAIIGLMVGVLFPSASSGVDSLRLNEASNKLVNFFNDALNRAERREQAVEISISKAGRTLSIRSPDLGEKTFSLPQGISIAAILPEQEQAESPEPPRRFMVYPGGTVPRVGVEIVNSRGARRIVRVDPITGVPRIEVPESR
jgi:prepilin-type N-terminal cleavage/methylation domain-containing protein